MIRVNRAISRLINTLFGGDENEMLSTRAWRTQNRPLILFLDAVFFWEPDHCRWCFESERERLREFVKGFDE